MEHAQSRWRAFGLVLIALLPVMVLAFGGCSPARDPWASARPDQKKVLALFAPLYCFAANVAGDHAKVLCLTTAEGPHDFVGTHRDALKVAGAEMLLHNGLELDEVAVEKLVRQARSRDKLVVVNLGKEIDHKLLEHNHEEEHLPKDAGHHHHGEHDPHIWLGLAQARAMVDVVARELGKLDPAHKIDFERNAAAYKKELDELEAYGKKKLEGVPSRKLITMHESLRYFAKTFDLVIVGSMMAVAGQDGDAGQRSKLVDKAIKEKVRVLAVEPQYRTSAADDLARALKGTVGEVRIVKVDPLETAPPDEGVNPRRDFYVKQMKQNIDVLAEALK